MASTEVTQHCQALLGCQAKQDVQFKSMARVFNQPMAASLLRHTACKSASCKLPSAALVIACKDRTLQSVKRLINRALHIAADNMQAGNSILGRLPMQNAICDISTISKLSRPECVYLKEQSGDSNTEGMVRQHRCNLTSPGEDGEASDRLGHLKAQASCTHCSCCSCKMAGFTLDTLSVLTVARDLMHS